MGLLVYLMILNRTVRRELKHRAWYINLPQGLLLAFEKLFLEYLLSHSYNSITSSEHIYIVYIS